ncbi:unnamed protein product [Mucor circinelloides]
MTTLEIANRKKENRLSRRLTVSTTEPYINIRPIIKKADKEAAYTLSEAYADNSLLNWVTGSIRDQKKNLTFIKTSSRCLSGQQQARVENLQCN